MSTNFLPKNIHKGVNSDGSSFKTEEFDLNATANINLFNGFWAILASGFIGLLLAPYFFVMAVLSFNGNKSLFWVSAIISGYVIFDFNKGWLILLIASLGFTDSELSHIGGGMGGILLCSAFMIIFGKQFRLWIINSFPEPSMRWIVYLITLFIICFIGFQFTLTKFETNNNAWVRSNLNLGPIEEPIKY